MGVCGLLRLSIVIMLMSIFSLSTYYTSNTQGKGLLMIMVFLIRDRQLKLQNKLWSATAAVVPGTIPELREHLYLS